MKRKYGFSENSSIRTSEVTDPHALDDAVGCLNFATPEDAQKAKALFEGMQSEIFRLRSELMER